MYKYTKQKRMFSTRHALSLFMAILLSLSMSAKKEAENSVEAKQMFEKIYGMVFGSEGSSLTYNVNIVGIYKTEGNITYKGKKQYFKDKRYSSWCDGVNVYKVDSKERTVNIYSANDDKRDKYMSKFKFDASKYIFSYKLKGNVYEITAKVRKSDLLGIKYVTITANKNNLYPSSVKIKMGFVSTTVKISNFKSGGINDAIFVYPKQKYSNYKVIDNR